MPYSLILDVVVAGLLIIMIPYVIRLNKRLSNLRKDKAQLEKLATTFSESTRRADDSLGNLRASAETMQRKLDSAQTLHDDLAFLLERGEKAADRLEDLARMSRSETASAGNTVSVADRAVSSKSPQSETPVREVKTKPTRPEEDDDYPRSEAERELLKAIRSAN